MEDQATVIIVGSGPAGLSAAACLSRRRITYILLERDVCFAPLWQKYSYDRLHVHLAKQFSNLPHMQFPSSYPTFVPKTQFIQYLNDYVSHFNITPTYRRSVELANYDEKMKKWVVKARNADSGEIEEYSGKFLVVATGETSDPFVPEIDGLRSLCGEIIHSTKYKNGKAYEKKNVLVVGSGNSGMEIALDLANHGANPSIVVRSPVLPAIESIRGNEVTFKNGKSHPFDTIIFSTGFKTSTNKWLKGDDSLLNDEGMSKQSYPNHWKGRNGLYCAGLARRGLIGINSDTENIANDIESLL